MSGQLSQSTKVKQNVKITSTVYNESIVNSARITAGSSKMNQHSLHQSASNIISEVMEKFQSRRRTLKLDFDSVSYKSLRVTSFLEFFREDWGGVTAIRYFQDGKRVAIGFNSGDLRICTPLELSHLKGGSSESILKGWEGNDSISCIQFHPMKPSLLYASSTGGSVLRRDLEDPSQYNEFFISEEDNEIFCMDFTKNCELVTVGRDATLRVYDVNVDRELCEYGNEFSPVDMNDTMDTYHEKRIYCVRCHPGEPSILVSGGWDGVKVWDLRTQIACVRSIHGPFIFGDTVDICNGMVLTASCVSKNCLQLWDLGSGLLINNVDPSNKRAYLYGEYPYVAKFLKGDSSGDLVLYGVDGLQIISVKESSILWLCEDEKPVIAVDSTDNKLAFGGKSNSVVHGEITFSDAETLISSSHFESMSTTTPSHLSMNSDINASKESTPSSIKNTTKSQPSSINSNPIN